MKDNLQTILITVALFVGGLLTGIWTQKTHPMPPPPQMGGGMQRPEMGGGPPSRFDSQHQPMREAMEEKLKEIRPEMEAFHNKMQEIENSFQQKLAGVLNAEQKRKMEDSMKSMHAGPMPPPPGGMPGGPQPGGPQVGGPQAGGPQPGGSPRPMEGGIPPGPPPHPGGGGDAMGIVLVKPGLERMTEDLKLDAKQQAEVKALLVEKRTKFLALVDDTPPPMMKMEKIYRETMGRMPQPGH